MEIKSISSAIKIKTKEVKDFILLIPQATQLFELYMINLQLEILKTGLIKKRGTNYNDSVIMAEINLACELQERCLRRV